MAFLLCDPGWYVQRNLMSRMNGKKTHTHTHAYFLRITLDLTVQSGPVLSQVSTVVLCYQIVALVRRVSVDPVWSSRSPDPPIYCVADDLRLYGITGDWSTTALDPGVWYSTVRDGGCRFMAAWVKEEEEKAVRTPAEEERSERGRHG